MGCKTNDKYHIALLSREGQEVKCSPNLPVGLEEQAVAGSKQSRSRVSRLKLSRAGILPPSVYCYTASPPV